MVSILGLGGESIVLRKEMVRDGAMINCGYKLSPTKKSKLSQNQENILGVEILISDTVKAYRNEKIKELTARMLLHKNVINYFHTTFEVIDNEVFHLSGIAQISHLFLQRETSYFKL